MPTEAPPAGETSAPPAAPERPKRGAKGKRAARGRKAAEAAGATPTVRHTVEPLSPGAEVVETDEAIVIRFPPVAPPPFMTPAPVAREAPSKPPAAAPRAPEVPPEESAPPARGKAVPAPAPVSGFVPAAAPPKGKAPAPPPPAVPPARTKSAGTERSRTAPQPVEAPGEEGKQTLTRSQRRRMRRKRHKESLQASGPEVSPADRTLPPAGGPQTPAAAHDEEDGEVFDPDTVLVNGDEAPPWLEDVEVVTAEAEESEAQAPPAKEKLRGRRRRRGRRSAQHEGPAVAAEAAEVEAAPAVAPKREMIINTVQREECRIAIIQDTRLEEIYLERAAAENHVGNIYKGVVTNVEPSIQAAFIDFGQGKNGFLHISDLHPQYFPDGAGHTENVGRKMPRRSRPPIQRCLRRGQELLVQVTKEGIGTKGPTLSTYLSIPGRFLVMMPGMRRLGVSRRIEDDDVRDKLRDLLNDLELPEGMGFIARTAAVERSKRELQNDLSYLTRLWKAVEKRIANEPAPAELYRESDLVIRTIRDVFTDDIERIVVDDAEVMNRAREFLSIFSPRSQDIVTLYTDPEPIFHKYKIEAELERLHSRYVPLKSGGSLVIDQAEALVAIDVNSGRFRTEDDAEATAYKINCEAADEIPRQLRLRDLGGVIVCDFIDMRMEGHRRDIERRLIENLKRHKERAKVLRTSAFGLIEMTRQRQRASLTRSVYRDCRHCRGTGMVKTVESVTLDVMRLIQLAVTREHIRLVEVSVSPEVSFLLQNRKRSLIHELESKYRRSVSIRPDPNFSLDQVEITCTDARGRVVPHM
jgi:ribonuclease E